MAFRDVTPKVPLLILISTYLKATHLRRPSRATAGSLARPSRHQDSHCLRLRSARRRSKPAELSRNPADGRERRLRLALYLGPRSRSWWVELSMSTIANADRGQVGSSTIATRQRSAAGWPSEARSGGTALMAQGHHRGLVVCHRGIHAKGSRLGPRRGAKFTAQAAGQRPLSAVRR
jgi:hypothetical protein